MGNLFEKSFDFDEGGLKNLNNTQENFLLKFGSAQDKRVVNAIKKKRETDLYKSQLKANQDKAIDDNIKITGEGVSSPALQKKIDEEKLRVTNAATASYNKSLGTNLTGELAMKSAGTSMGSGKLPVGDNVKKSGSQIGKHMNKYGV